MRSRQKKRENFKNIEADIDYLKLENIKLKQENEFLKNEKLFLVDQIKFMQNLIKSHNLVLVSNTNLTVNSNIFHSSNINCNVNLENKNSVEIKNPKNFDIEKNLCNNKITNNEYLIANNEDHQRKKTNYDNVSIEKYNKQTNNEICEKNNNTKNIYLNGKNQKKIGKVFSIFIICLLSIFYMSTADFSSNEKIVFNNNSIMSLNEYNDNTNTTNNIYPVYLFHAFIILLLILLYLPVYLVVRWIIKQICGIFKIKKVKIVKNL